MLEAWCCFRGRKGRPGEIEAEPQRGGKEARTEEEGGRRGHVVAEAAKTLHEATETEETQRLTEHRQNTENTVVKAKLNWGRRREGGREDVLFSEACCMMSQRSATLYVVVVSMRLAWNAW